MGFGSRRFNSGIVIGTAAAGRIRNVAWSRREKVIRGKLDFPEGIAGLIGGIVAMLFRNTEVIYGYKHLNIPYKLYYCEKTERYINGGIAVLKVCNHIAAYAVAYAFRYAAHAVVAVSYFTYSCRQRNRVNRLNNAFRHIRASACASVAVVVLAHCA